MYVPVLLCWYSLPTALLTTVIRDRLDHQVQLGGMSTPIKILGHEGIKVPLLALRKKRKLAKNTGIIHFARPSYVYVHEYTSKMNHPCIIIE